MNFQFIYPHKYFYLRFYNLKSTQYTTCQVISPPKLKYIF